MLFPDIDPIAFAIGPFAIRWYALGYLFGVGLGAVYGSMLLANSRLWHRGQPPFPAKDIWDFAFWTMLAIVVGGRVGYVLFYNLPYYLANPAQILNTLDGGMSYHGGMLGLMLAVILFTRKKGGNWLSGLDLIASVSTIGIFLVRIANYINAELYGAPTSLPWAVVFPTDPEQLPRHPSQLYEAVLEGLVMFCLRWWVASRPRPRYAVAGKFALLYGGFRFAVEFVREPDAQIGYLAFGWLTMGQLLSIPLVLVGLFWLWLSRRQPTLQAQPATGSGQEA